MRQPVLVGLLVAFAVAFAGSGAAGSGPAGGGRHPERVSPPIAGRAGDSRVAAYAAALRDAITRNWLRPDDLPSGVACPVHVVQIPGGQVTSVKISTECPFNEVGRHSMVSAVLRASPLPYRGFEDVFRRDIILNFKVEK